VSTEPTPLPSGSAILVQMEWHYLADPRRARQAAAFEACLPGAPVTPTGWCRRRGTVP